MGSQWVTFFTHVVYQTCDVLWMHAHAPFSGVFMYMSGTQVQFMSLEKEVFPFMAQDGELFAFDLEGTYM